MSTTTQSGPLTITTDDPLRFAEIVASLTETDAVSNVVEDTSVEGVFTVTFDFSNTEVVSEPEEG